MWLRRLMASRLASSVLPCGCSTGWRRISVADRVAVPGHQQAEVWRRGHVQRLQGLVVSGDSVGGIPFPHTPGCDTCRVAIARTEVDSIRVGDPTTAFWQSALLGVGVAAGVYEVLCLRSNLCGLNQ